MDVCPSKFGKFTCSTFQTEQIFCFKKICSLKKSCKVDWRFFPVRIFQMQFRIFFSRFRKVFTRSTCALSFSDRKFYAYGYFNYRSIYVLSFIYMSTYQHQIISWQRAKKKLTHVRHSAHSVDWPFQKYPSENRNSILLTKDRSPWIVNT